MRYLFLMVFLAFLLAMGMPFIATADETLPEDSVQVQETDEADTGNDAVDVELSTSPHAVVDFVANEIRVSSMPEAGGLLDNPSGVIGFDLVDPDDPRDNVLTVSPGVDIGGTGVAGNSDFGQGGDHPTPADHPGGH